MSRRSLRRYHSARGRRCGFVVVVAVFAALPSIAAHSPAAHGRGGAVASSEGDATVVGIEVLKAGGNAVDAAVATALALAVVHPQAGNLGGGGFAVVRMNGELATLDFRETAPAAARPGMFLDADGEPVAGASLVGPLAAAVPGSPAGYFELHRRYGRLSWPRVVEPAVRLARDGFTVTERLHRSLVEERAHLARFPETAVVWLPGGVPPEPGTTMRLPALARALADYAARGPEALTTGSLAEAIVAASARHGGILSRADLAAYRPVWREPLRFECFGWNVAGMGLPSSGGLIVGEACDVIARLGWQTQPRFGAQRAHLLAEAWRRAFADRFLLGDPSTSGARLVELLRPERLAGRARLIDLRHATPSATVQPVGATASLEPTETTHIAVLDSAGDAVSLTTTLNDTFGCRLLVPQSGYFLNSEMDDFTVAPGHPNDYGLIQGEANAVRPGKRMLSSMSPTIAWRGEELLVLGGRGGSKIPTATLQVLLNVIVDGDRLQAAVSRARLHHQWFPDEIAVEADTLAPETAVALTAMGHRIAVLRTTAKVNAVRRLSDGTFEAAADPRGPSAAAVVSPAPGSVAAVPTETRTPALPQVQEPVGVTARGSGDQQDDEAPAGGWL